MNEEQFTRRRMEVELVMTKLLDHYGTFIDDMWGELCVARGEPDPRPELRARKEKLAAMCQAVLDGDPEEAVKALRGVTE